MVPVCSSFGQTEWQIQPTSTAEFLSDIAYSETLAKYIAVGDAGTILSSPDSTNWTTEDSGSSNGLRSAIFADGQFVAVGQSGTILTSVDGTNWDIRESGTNKFLSGIAHAADRYVAVGGSGTIVTSTDGITWIPAVSGTSRFLQDVRFADGKFVAAGSSGTIRTSEDGTNWDVITTGRTEILTAIAHFADSWYVAGQAGTLLSSPDGTTWNPVASGTSSWIRAFASDGERLVAVGEEGTVRLSFDAATWLDIDSGVGSVLTGCGFWNGQFIAAGEPTSTNPQQPAFGLILTSPQVQYVRWESNSKSVSESDAQLSIDLIRSSPLGDDVMVEIGTSDGSASASSDFSPPAAEAQFLDGADRLSVEVPIHNNPEAEPQESFSLTVSVPEGTPLLVFPPATIDIAIIDAQDSDTDGLLDSWEVEHFSSIHAFGSEDDPDGDNNDNGREFSDGTDPSSVSSALYTLELSTGFGSGSVAASPAMEKYPAAETVALTPEAADGLTFASWSGDMTGGDTPLQLVMTRDLVISANFTLSLSGALDTESRNVPWTSRTTGGAVWIAQDAESFDGEDAALVSGGGQSETATISTQVFGPANLSFHWMFEPGPGTTLEFLIDGSPQFVISAPTDWTRLTLPVPAGEHELSWRYKKGPAGELSTGRAGLDLVSLENSYEVWALATFDPADAGDPQIVAPGADPDGDSYDNLLEYLLGNNPMISDAGSANSPRVTFSDVEGVRTPVLNYNLVASRAAPYQIDAWVSGDLIAGWERLPEPVLIPDGLFQSARIFDESDSNRRYYRISAKEKTP